MKRHKIQISRLLSKSPSKLLVSCKSSSTSSTSSTTNKGYTIQDLEIPSVPTPIAGKLWQGTAIKSSLGQPGRTPEVPILAIHGWLDNSCTFDTLLPLIMTPYRQVFAMDVPGHGLSPFGSHQFFYNRTDPMLSALGVIHHFGWDKVVLLGHSMGSAVSFSMSGIFPELVHAYVGFDVVRIPSVNFVAELRKIVHGMMKLEDKFRQFQNSQPPSYSYDELVRRTFVGRKRSVSEEGCKVLLKRGAIQNSEGRYLFSHDPRVTFPASILWSRQLSQEIVRNINCPVCLIKGEPGEYYEPKEDFMMFVKYMEETIGDKMEFHFLSGTHHFHLNEPEPVARIVKPFLEKVMPLNGHSGSES